MNGTDDGTDDGTDGWKGGRPPPPDRQTLKILYKQITSSKYILGNFWGSLQYSHVRTTGWWGDGKKVLSTRKGKGLQSLTPSINYLYKTSVNPVHNAPRQSPHPVLRISHSGSLPPIKTPGTPPPPPPPFHEKNKNHDPPKPLTQKKHTQISSPILQIPKISPLSTTTIIARKRKNKSKK